jgi:hypothetical protein
LSDSAHLLKRCHLFRIDDLHAGRSENADAGARRNVRVLAMGWNREATTRPTTVRGRSRSARPCDARLSPPSVSDMASRGATSSNPTRPNRLSGCSPCSRSGRRGSDVGGGWRSRHEHAASLGGMRWRASKMSLHGLRSQNPRRARDARTSIALSSGSQDAVQQVRSVTSETRPSLLPELRERQIVIQVRSSTTAFPAAAHRARRRD